MKAKLEQTCPYCHRTIYKGDEIELTDRGWMHGPLFKWCRTSRGPVYIELEDRDDRQTNARNRSRKLERLPEDR